MDINTVASATYSIWNIGSFFFAIIGALSFVVLTIGAFTRLGKAGWRFGLALFGKKIMIVANDDDYRNLKQDLSDSGLIKKKNILHISDKHLSKTNDALLLIIAYGYMESDDFRDVVNRKNARCGLIVYCPPEKGRIKDEEMEILSKSAFTTICNLRGRLVNDVLLMMLSTSFKKKDLASI